MIAQRRTLPHNVPSWVKDDAIYFVTICGDPRWSNQFCTRKCGSALWRMVSHYEASGECWVPLCLLMPDHIHLLISVAPDIGLKSLITRWKHYSSRHFGVRWQRDFFDHRIRSDESLSGKAGYIRLNPVRAGLVACPDDWPYKWGPWS